MAAEASGSRRKEVRLAAGWRVEAVSEEEPAAEAALVSVEVAAAAVGVPAEVLVGNLLSDFV